MDIWSGRVCFEIDPKSKTNFKNHFFTKDILAFEIEKSKADEPFGGLGFESDSNDYMLGRRGSNGQKATIFCMQNNIKTRLIF